ncbi:MAG: DUF4981 domain-containing protein, partial [Gemmatimonadota bacterium]|nr:DUF4981 domain-containing protein [Gemmatimonadota bacterium]
MDLTSGRLAVAQWYAFRVLTGLTGRWEVRADGEVVASGALPELATAPGGVDTVALNVPRVGGWVEEGVARVAALPGVEYLLDVTLRSREDAPLVPAGHLVASEQFKLQQERPIEASPPGAPLSASETPTDVLVSGGDFTLR